jgi:sterol desaturase/sphingolipid hydroxylase (fatty acid hydroxylase superfamily)
MAVGAFLIILERIIPDQKLPHVSGWWTRVIIINILQLGVLFLGKITWDKWFSGSSLIDLSAMMGDVQGGLVAYGVTTFVFYWWHRWRHTVNFLWLTFHQLHHSPNRIETITSFYKHPAELIANSILLGAINFALLGVSIEGAAWALLFASIGEYVYHMNIRTPHWLGYIFQRPEMHRIHHQQGRHKNNFSDIPLWDMLFGTFENPIRMDKKCGFKDEKERRLLDILLFKNVNNPYPPEK